MSYDLAVFDPAAAPTDRDAFLDWYETQIAWREDHRYDDPANCAPRLAAWFFDMVKTFPTMNGPHAARSKDASSRVTDFSLGTSMIYAAFAWSQAEAAYRATIDLAAKHDLGFYDVSGLAGEVWAPVPGRGFVCIHRAR